MNSTPNTPKSGNQRPAYLGGRARLVYLQAMQPRASVHVAHRATKDSRGHLAA